MWNLKMPHNRGKPSKVCTVRHLAVPAPYRPRVPLKASCRHSVNAIHAYRNWILRRITCGLSCKPLPAGVRESGGSGVKDSKDPQDCYGPRIPRPRQDICSPSGRVRHSAVQRRTERFYKPVRIIPGMLCYGAPQHLKVCHSGERPGGSGIPKGAMQYIKHLIVQVLPHRIKCSCYLQ